MTLTGSAVDPTTSPQATGPASADLIASGAMDNSALQPLLNFISWLRTHIVPDTGGTFTGAVNGVTPTAAAHLTRKDYVDGLLSAPGWSTLNLINSWTGTLKYRKDGLGLVWVKGSMTAGASGTFHTAALPAGCHFALGELATFAAWDRNGTPATVTGYVLWDGTNDNMVMATSVSGHLYDFLICYRPEA